MERKSKMEKLETRVDSELRELAAQGDLPARLCLEIETPFVEIVKDCQAKLHEAIAKADQDEMGKMMGSMNSAMVESLGVLIAAWIFGVGAQSTSTGARELGVKMFGSLVIDKARMELERACAEPKVPTTSEVGHG